MDDQRVLSEVESWPVEDRVRLVREVWERLSDEGHGTELTEEMKAELDHRIEEMDRNSGSGVPWEAVKARLLARFEG